MQPAVATVKQSLLEVGDRASSYIHKGPVVLKGLVQKKKAPGGRTGSAMALAKVRRLPPLQLTKCSKAHHPGAREGTSGPNQ